jgi:hypothetical protein
MAERFRYRQRVRYHEGDPQGVVFNGQVFLTAGEGGKVSIPDGVRSGLAPFLAESVASTAGEAHEPRRA